MNDEAFGRSGGLSLSVVVPTHSTRDLTLRCLDSVAVRAQDGDEVIVVDDASLDDTVAQVRRRFPGARVLELGSRSGFTAAANRGLAAANGDLILLLNSDTELLGGGLTALREAFERQPRLGVAGARLSYPDGEPQWSGGREPGPLWAFALASGAASLLASFPGYRRVRPVQGGRRNPRRVDWVTGAALACRGAMLREVGAFDSRFRFYAQDLELCSRVRRAGWRVEIVPGFRVMHVHGATIENERGSVSRYHPELLWTDLVRWAEVTRGPVAAARLRNALRLGGSLRWLALWAGARLRRGDRQSEKQRAEAYRQALTALDDPPPSG